MEVIIKRWVFFPFTETSPLLFEVFVFGDGEKQQNPAQKKCSHDLGLELKTATWTKCHFFVLSPVT